MNQGVYPLAASMINQINRIDMISNNLANVNTNGFKQEGSSEGSFNYYLQKANENNITPSKINVVTNTIPKMDGKYIDAEQGAILSTGNSLDFALREADHFFTVQDDDGERYYTRDGAFKNSGGFLVDSNNRLVLDSDNEPIVVQEGFERQVGVARIDYENMTKYKDNLYKVEDGFVEPFGLNDGLTIQGALEKSNVNSVTSMVGLIDAHRRFEQSQKAISTIDEMNRNVIEKIGSNTR